MFFDIITKLCIENNVKLSPLLDELGLSRGNISNWKRGIMPKRDVLNKFSKYFNVSIDYLSGETESKKGVRIPVLGCVKAGIPIEAIQDIIDYEEISLEMASQGEHFALQVRGDSMEPRFVDGDVVIVRKQEDVDSGDIAVVLINGFEATLKRIKKYTGGISLVSTNEKYNPFSFTTEQVKTLPVEILGKVVELRAKF